jgi:hypothetical protein
MLNGMRKPIYLAILLLIFVFSATPVLSQSSHDLLALDTESFSLLQDEQGYSLKYTQNKRISLPKAWLVPPDEVEEDEVSYVSSFNYDERVTAFQIGDGRKGLHVSSYDIQKEGSAQAAAGRDVFLIFDEQYKTIHPGGLAAGVTKERVRQGGRFSAKFHSFMIGDVNNDRLIDIGVIKEDIECLTGPLYKQEPVRWYVFEGNRWKNLPNFVGKFPPAGQLKLPLIGMAKSPVDFVKQICPDREQRMKRRQELRRKRPSGVSAVE